MKLKDFDFRIWNNYIQNYVTYPVHFRMQDYLFIPKNDESLEIELFTGFKDKNGVKIFEGDIVKVTDRDTGGGAKYEVYIDNKKGVSLKGSSFTLCEMMCIHDVEVVGNIHQNSD